MVEWKDLGWFEIPNGFSSIEEAVEYSTECIMTTHTTPPTAPQFLAQAESELTDRAATYDAPEGERSMGKTVAAFNAATGHNLTEQQGWQFMEILKIVRSNQGAYRADCFVDGAAYAALAGEAAAREK